MGNIGRKNNLTEFLKYKIKQRISQLRQHMQKEKTIFISPKYRFKKSAHTEPVDLLLRKMVDTANDRKCPVESVWEGYKFVIGSNEFFPSYNMTLYMALSEWKKQACIPHYEEKMESETGLKDVVNRLETNSFETRIDDTSHSYEHAAMVEVLAQKHPEYLDKVTMLQVLSAFIRQDGNIENEVVKRLKAYTEGGKEDFPLTLQNVVTLKETVSHNLPAGFLQHHGIDETALKNRLSKTEEKMINEIQDGDLSWGSVDLLKQGLAIVQEHKGGDIDGTVEKKKTLFTNQIAKREEFAAKCIAQGSKNSSKGK